MLLTINIIFLGILSRWDGINISGQPLMIREKKNSEGLLQKKKKGYLQGKKKLIRPSPGKKNLDGPSPGKKINFFCCEKKRFKDPQEKKILKGLSEGKKN